MHKKNLKKLIDHLESIPDESYQQEYIRHPSCGTPACIAGYAYALAKGYKRNKRIPLKSETNGNIKTAKKWLKLKDTEASQLFAPYPLDAWLRPFDSSPTRQDAIDTLKRFLDTGYIVWTVKAG